MDNNRAIFAHKLFVSLNSDTVAPGGIFIAAQGMREHGAQHIAQALERGAREIVIDHTAHISDDVKKNIVSSGAILTITEDARRAAAQMSAAHYQHPAQSLYLIGVTGTKGKTTTAYIINHILRSQGYRTALLGTVENIILDTSYQNDLTTPQADYLHAFMRAAVDRGVTHLVMEVAAQALSMQRVCELLYHHVIWLNFGKEHGEFYTTPEIYFNAKAMLLDQLRPDGCITASADDPHIMHAAQQRSCAQTFFSRSMITLSQTNVASKTSQYITDNITFLVRNLYGSFNGDNILAALQVADRVGISRSESLASLTSFPGVPGRMNWYSLPNGARACIDYAHTPNSFDAVLSELRQHTPHLIVVFGAGGDRDASKRPLMGMIAAQYADIIILTSDNPRSEEVKNIIQDIQNGIVCHSNVRIIIDREEAIRTAYQLSQSNSIIALLGKGPDEYQIIGSQKHRFSERDILANL